MKIRPAKRRRPSRAARAGLSGLATLAVAPVPAARANDQCGDGKCDESLLARQSQALPTPLFDKEGPEASSVDDAVSARAQLGFGAQSRTSSFSNRHRLEPEQRALGAQVRALSTIAGSDLPSSMIPPNLGPPGSLPGWSIALRDHEDLGNVRAKASTSLAPFTMGVDALGQCMAMPQCPAGDRSSALTGAVSERFWAAQPGASEAGVSGERLIYSSLAPGLVSSLQDDLAANRVTLRDATALAAVGLKVAAKGKAVAWSFAQATIHRPQGPKLRLDGFAPGLGRGLTLGPRLAKAPQQSLPGNAAHKGATLLAVARHIDGSAGVGSDAGIGSDAGVGRDWGASARPAGALAQTKRDGFAPNACFGDAVARSCADVTKSSATQSFDDRAISPVRHNDAVARSAQTARVQSKTAPSPGRRVLPQIAFGLASDGGGDPGPATGGRGVGTADDGASSQTMQLPGDVRGPDAPFSAADELIFEFHAGDGHVSQTITAYGNRAATYLPLGEIARLLDLALTVSDEGRYASGWVLDEQQRVSVNLRSGQLSIAGREIALRPSDAQAFEGELYMRSTLFESLMPAQFAVDLRSQAVTVKTTTPFPFEQRAAREAARERLAAPSSARSGSSYEPEPTPYRAIDVPLGEIEMRAVSNTARGMRIEGDLRLAGDLAYMTGQIYLSANTRDGATAARFTLGRRDVDGRLLGPLGATVFEAGDVTTDALALGLRGIAGRGFALSNMPLERASVFERIDLRGELPTGWEAELYRNNTLVGSTSTPVNGRYEFLQVPVEFGLNVFRVVQFGPQGQRRESVRQLSVGDGRLAAGEVRYAVSLAQRDVNLLGLTGPNFVPGEDYGRWRGSGQVSWGVSSAMTVNLGAGWFDADAGQGWLASAGLRTGIGAVAGQFNLGINNHKGLAADARLAGRTYGVAWTVVHAEYAGRFSDELRAFSAQPLRRASEVDLVGTAHFGRGSQGLALPVAARLRRLEFADSRVQVDGSLRGSAMLAGMLVSKSITLSRSTGAGREPVTQVLGSFDLATVSSGRTRYRAMLGYALAPGARVSQVGVDIDRTFGPDTMVKASLVQAFDTRQTIVGTSAVHRFGPVALSVDGTVSFPRKEHALMLRVGVSFGRNPVSRSFFAAPPGLTAGGAIAVAAYEDSNANRMRDTGEAAIAGARIDTGSQVTGTASDGVAFLGQLGAATRTFVRLDSESLPDIAMAPSRTGFAIVPRPGRIHVSQFAIDVLGEIEGTAVYGDDRRGVSGLALVLKDKDGRSAGRVRSGTGGAFLFEHVRPGRYELAVDPDQARRLALAAVEPVKIEIDAMHRLVRTSIQVRTLASP